MLKSFFLKGAKASVGRWVVLLIDVSIVLQSFFIAYLVNFNFKLSFQSFGFFSQLGMIAILSMLSFFIVGSYKGTVRQTGMKDALNVIYGVSILCLSLILITLTDREFNVTHRFAVPYSVITIHYLLNIICFNFQ